LKTRINGNAQESLRESEQEMSETPGELPEGVSSAVFAKRLSKNDDAKVKADEWNQWFIPPRMRDCIDELWEQMYKSFDNFGRFRLYRCISY